MLPVALRSVPLLDDREERAGGKFADMDLIGVADVVADWRARMPATKGFALYAADPERESAIQKAGLNLAGGLDDLLAAADIVIDHGRCRDANDQGMSSTIIDFRDWSVVRAGCRFDEIKAFAQSRFGISLSV